MIFLKGMFQCAKMSCYRLIEFEISGKRKYQTEPYTLPNIGWWKLHFLEWSEILEIQSHNAKSRRNDGDGPVVIYIYIIKWWSIIDTSLILQWFFFWKWSILLYYSEPFNKKKGSWSPPCFGCGPNLKCISAQSQTSWELCVKRFRNTSARASCEGLIFP